jgi:aryl-alcohol dehydrogenase-like predicted oxidoreductase
MSMQFQADNHLQPQLSPQTSGLQLTAQQGRAERAARCRAILEAVKAGVRIDYARVRLGLHCASAARPALAACKRYGIVVVADEATMFGCVDEAFVGVPCPSHFQTDPPVPSVAAVAGVVSQMGGWPEVQKALATVQDIARKHGVTMQTVALRWCIDQGATPVVLSSWSHAGGCMGKGPLDEGSPADAQLFQRDSLLDDDDMARLNAVAK